MNIYTKNQTSIFKNAPMCCKWAHVAMRPESCAPPYFLEDDDNHTIQIMFELDLASLSDGAQPSSAMDSFLSSTSKNKPLYKKN